MRYQRPAGHRLGWGLHPPPMSSDQQCLRGDAGLGKPHLDHLPITSAGLSWSREEVSKSGFLFTLSPKIRPNKDRSLLSQTRGTLSMGTWSLRRREAKLPALIQWTSLTLTHFQV